MLLLFWKIHDHFRSGNLTATRWYHQPHTPSWIMCATDGGYDLVHPYYEELGYWSYGFTPTPATSIDKFNNDIIIGTTNGVYSVPWEAAANIDPDVEKTPVIYATVASGLLSNEIVAIGSQNNYLGIVSTSGLNWLKTGGSYITYETTEGKDVFIKTDGTTYFAENDTVMVKDGEPVDFSSWDRSYTVSGVISDLWVNESTNTIFVATDNGACVFEDKIGSPVQYFNGGESLIALSIEGDAKLGWGHFFTMTSGVLFLNSLVFNNSRDVAIVGGVDLEYPRFNSK